MTVQFYAPRFIEHLRARPAVNETDARHHRNSKRVCVVCKHAICPGCGDWCDTLLGDDQDFCCEGECVWLQLP